MAELRENCIEWLNGQKTVAVSLNQQKYINKVRKLAKQYPEMVTILAENEDGSIFAHLPLKAVKLSIITRKEEALSDEEGEELEDE